MHKESSDFMYGLLGKKLEHSFSKKIHEEFVNLEYSLIEKEEIYSFFIKRPFKGINVTIPYKKEVIQYLDELSPEAKEIGAVNTIINNSGKLTGYNTDYYGLEKALQYNDISVLDKVVAILGNGSTSRTIIAYCTKNLAKKIHVFARNPRENEYHFSDVENLKNCSIIFNATPVGMFPNNNDDMLIDLNSLPNLISVVDVLYNPLRSNLLIEAEKRGKKTVNGLLMLIWQAVKSIKLFHNIEISDDDVLKYYKKILMESYNLVFIGMPMSGKSFFASLCATQYSKKLIDLDNVIEKNNKDTIENIFQVHGEQYFRNLESKEILNYSKWHNQAISCGGGVVLNSDNIRNLKQNSIILFIDVPLEMLKKCNPKNRPLLKDKRNLVNLYNSRYELYKQYADIIIEKNTYDKDVTLNQIEVKINEYINS